MITVGRIFRLACEIRLRNWKIRRGISLLFRLFLRRREVSSVLDFFEKTEFRRKIFSQQHDIIDIVPRNLLYARSTPAERAQVMIDHFTFCEKVFTEEAILKIYRGVRFSLGGGIEIDGKQIRYTLQFTDGDRKEGLMVLEISLDNVRVYQVNFWFAPAKDGTTPALWVGALQGANADDAQDIIKKLSKHFAFLRPKNLMMHIVQAFARETGCGKLYAVANHGYYAQNGVRVDRKLKTDLDEFWRELGGTELSEDARFFDIPLDEIRKSESEMKPNKKSMYRKRFKMLDELYAEIHERLAPLKRQAA